MDFVAYLPFAGIILGGLIAGVFTVLNRRGADRGQTLKLAPLTATEMWAEMTDLRVRIEAVEKRERKRMRAMSSILSALYEQWPGTEAPVLPASAVEVLEDTIPPRWFPQPRVKR